MKTDFRHFYFLKNGEDWNCYRTDNYKIAGVVRRNKHAHELWEFCPVDNSSFLKGYLINVIEFMQELKDSERPAKPKGIHSEIFQTGFHKFERIHYVGEDD